MAIAPTVEKIGDSALTDSIIDRSITELQDNILETLQPYALAECSSLRKCVFGEVTEVLNDCFSGCEALETLDFYATVEFDASALQSLPSLKTLILRSNTMCDASSSAVLSYTPIAEGTGYIYVPAALVESYRDDFVWGEFANQIRAIEDYPLVSDKYSWEAVQWSMDNGTYATDYAIGDCVPIDLGSEGIINMQVAAFDADDLADGSGKAKISWVAKELLATVHQMNPILSPTPYQEGTGCIGGWEKCTMRTYLNDTIKPLLPASARSCMVAVAKAHRAYDTTVTAFTQNTTDELFLASDVEVQPGGIYAGLFPDNASRIKYLAGNATGARAWWLRSGSSIATNGNAFDAVNVRGSIDLGGAVYEHGVCLGFCTGKAT